jgi:hypothetical protein
MPRRRRTITVALLAGTLLTAAAPAFASMNGRPQVSAGFQCGGGEPVGNTVGAGTTMRGAQITLIGATDECTSHYVTFNWTHLGGPPSGPGLGPIITFCVEFAPGSGAELTGRTLRDHGMPTGTANGVSMMMGHCSYGAVRALRVTGGISGPVHIKHLDPARPSSDQ